MTHQHTEELHSIATSFDETSGGMHWLYGEMRKVLADMLAIAAGEGQTDSRLDKLRTALETTQALASDIRGQQRLLIERLRSVASEAAKDVASTN
jgi:hypothetical protein